MTGFWIRFLITACGLLVASRLLDGMHFGGAASLLFAALVYWLFTFTFSRISLRMEKKLGVGER